MTGPNPGTTQHLTASERRAATGLAGVFAARMLGLFMVLPVFALHAGDMAGATPLLIGVAIGAYGLTQALLQIPFGMLSDRFGRKPIIAIGLLVFAAGSVVAALSDSILGMIVGRALQGSGAVAAAVMALAADLTREEIRLRVMAGIGASIGVAFALALVVGPILNRWFSLSGIFWVTAGLALVSLLVLLLWVPDPTDSRRHYDAESVPEQFQRVLRDRQLLRLDLGIFSLHAILTATFVTVPLLLRDGAGMPSESHWQMYLVVLAASLATMIPFLMIAERRRRLKGIFLGGIVFLGIAEFGLSVTPGDMMAIGVLLWIFFTAFNLLEATLPSLVAKLSPPDAKGTAMGVYSSAQFSGAFVGGSVGGWLHGAFGSSGVFVFGGAAAVLWLTLAASMKHPRYLSSLVIRVAIPAGIGAERVAARLKGVAGVAEAVVRPEQGVAYLKVDRRTLDNGALAAAVTDGESPSRDMSRPEG